MIDELSNYSKVKNNFIIDSENILNNNPYNMLGIEEKEYSNEDLSQIFENKINKLLDAYNSIKKENDKMLKKIR